MARRNLFSLSRPQLERWRTGDVVEHRKLNAPLDAIEEITRGIRPPYEVTQDKPTVKLMRHVVIRAIPEAGANWLTVRDVVPTGIGTSWDGTFSLDGADWKALVHPYSYAGDYTGLVWAAETLTPETPILKAYLESGAWWVSIYLRHELRKLPAETIFHDCTPEVEP